MQLILLLTLMYTVTARAGAEALIVAELMQIDRTGNGLTFSSKIGGQPVSAIIDLPGDIESLQARTVSDRL